MYAAQFTQLGLRIARSCVHSASRPNSVTNAYIRASCAYQISSGEAAPKAAATRPVRRSYSSLPEQVERRDHERPGDQRREPDGQLAVAERAHGQPERDVVQRRMAIPVLQVLEHVVEAEVRLVDADRLVEPDARVARQAAAPARRASRPPARPGPRSASCRARRAWAAGRGDRTAPPPALRGAVATSSANSLRPAP